MLPELELREGWVTVICLLLVFLCVAWAIQAAGWAEGLSALQSAVLVGGLLGIVLAKSRTPNRMAHLLSLLGGWAWSTYLTGQAIARATQMPWRLAIIDLDGGLQDFFLAVIQGGSGADNYVFVLLLSFSLWIMAYFGAWAVFRWQRVWWAVIVSGVALLLNVNYAQDDMTQYLILFLISGLLLVVRANVAIYEQEWRRAQVGYSSDLISSTLQAGLVISVVVILVAWMAPSVLASRPLQPFWDRVAEPWRKLQERSAEVFQNLNYSNPAPLIRMGESRMFFGGPVSLPDTPVADVEARNGRYWRVRVFHDYLGDGWFSNDPDVLLIEENRQELAFPDFELRSELTQTVRTYEGLVPGDALIAAGQPLRASVPLRAAVTLVNQGEGLVGEEPEGDVSPPALGDPSVLQSRRSLEPGEAYQVVSSLTEADEESLREAGTTYPDWVAPRYLQLPDSLPERVRLLAAQITNGLDAPYDKAKAIETYLRQIPYNLRIQGPAPGQDGVDYFLFDEQEGYCDYYASAMVVMLRAVDVPARYVRGYASMQREEGVYRLLESDAHAWPEVFFPSYGWVEFEPTGGQPVLLRPRSQDPVSEPNPSRGSGGLDELPDDLDEPHRGGGLAELETPSPFLLTLERLRGVAWALLGFGTVGLIAVLAFRIYRERQLAGLSSAERAYFQLVSWVHRLLGLQPMAHQTPHEYAGVVAETVPQGRLAVEEIAGYYVQERFGGREISAEQADGAWAQAWSALWRRWIARRTERLRRIWWKLVPPRDLAEE
jgi:hypothetical protein